MILIERRRFLEMLTLGAGGSALVPTIALAQSNDSVLAVTEMVANSLDTHTPGSNRACYGVSWMVYDRLLTFGTRRVADGGEVYDYYKLEPELAERWAIARDGTGVTFYLKRNAVFHDGTPVTARDVKWSFDRMVTVGGFPQSQMEQASLVRVDQFEAIDDFTFHITFIRPDKLTLPSLAIVVPAVYNSALCKQHATARDPWALEWTRSNAAGSGAYRVDSFKSGEQIVLSRFDEWRGGARPQLARVLIRSVPAAGTRAALFRRGDADFSMELPPRDFKDIADTGDFKIASTPMLNTVKHLSMLTTAKPFDDVRVRRAVACAVPYDDIIAAAVFGRARNLHGAPATAPTEATWPQPFPYRQDLARARALLAEAGYSKGFQTRLAFDAQLATTDEPAALLIQSALAQVGIQVTLEKVPNFPALRGQKAWPMAIDMFSGWFDDPDFYFRWIWHGQNSIWNLASYRSAAMDALLDAARVERDGPKYATLARQFIRLAMDDVPVVPLYQPMLDIAMQRNIDGYVYMFHRQVDFRRITKS